MRNAILDLAKISIAAVAYLALCGSSIAFAQATSGPIWGVSCVGTASGLDCRAVQSLPMSGGQASVAVQLPADTKKPIMYVLVPMGVYLPAGVTLQFGQAGAKKVSLRSCDSSGCLAQYALTEAELGALSKGQALVISVQGVDQKPVTLQVPSTGFAAAYAKIK